MVTSVIIVDLVQFLWRKYLSFGSGSHPHFIFWLGCILSRFVSLLLYRFMSLLPL
jgi:hypothetical protein